MAFTGTPTIRQVTDRLVRITGVSLAAGTAGTVGLFGDSGANLQLPDAFNPKAYDLPYGIPGVVALTDSIQVTVQAAALTVTPAVAASTSAMFYGLTAGTGNGGASDYAGTVAVDAAVPFPRLGPATANSTVVAGGTNQFVLAAAGIYRVSWAIDFLEASQLLLKLGTVEQAHTTTMSGAGTQQNTNCVLIDAAAGDLLSLCNASGNAAALTVQTADGSLTHAQAPSLMIELISDAAASDATSITVIKTGSPFRFTVTNNNAGTATPNLEIYARWML